MVKHDILGFRDENEYFKYFFGTLLKTNWTYDYFVDWQKVRNKIKNHVKEISLLNSLTKIRPEKRKDELKEIFTKYPETIPVIPIIIAIREHSIPLLEVGEKALYRVFNFYERKLKEDEAQDLVEFCEKVQILQLFAEINDLYAYLLGVEVGLDSNARKNRSGKIFQDLVGLLLMRKLKDSGLEMRSEDSSVVTKRSKRADFVIYSEMKPWIAIECNFYNTTGSKPIETASAYVDLQRRIRQKEGIHFIWITDGPAWDRMKPTIIQSFKEIDFPMNYTVANERIDAVMHACMHANLLSK